MNDHINPVMRAALAPFMPALKPDEYYLPGDDEGWGCAHQQQLDEQLQQDEGRDD